MKERIAKFMVGRNGNDELNMFLFGICAFLLILGMFISSLRSVLYFISLALLVYIYFRMFSKNRYKRSDENARFLRARFKLFGYLKSIKERWVQRKDYKFFTCPSCKAVLRVPKGHGKIKIVCRKCGNTFIGKS